MSVGIWLWPKECAWPQILMGCHTHSLGWFQLLCMSKTNHYICFYFVFCLWIEIRGKKIVASVKNNYIGFILLDLLACRVWLVERDKGGERKRRNWLEHKIWIETVVKGKKLPFSMVVHICIHTCLSTYGFPWEWKHQDMLEHTEVYTSEWKIQDIQWENCLPLFLQYVIPSQQLLPTQD